MKTVPNRRHPPIGEAMKKLKPILRELALRVAAIEISELVRWLLG